VKFDSFLGLLLWLASAGGLGVVSSWLVEPIKKLFKFEDWAARVLALIVAVVLGVAAIILVQFQVYEPVERYWSLIYPVLVFVFSQLAYFGPKRSG
jgi:hypothetical protein